MIVNDFNVESNKYLLLNKDTCGIYRHVKSFNTETKEAEIYTIVEENQFYELFNKMRDKYKPPFLSLSRRVLIDSEKEEVIFIKTKLLNAVLINKETGEEIV